MRIDVIPVADEIGRVDLTGSVALVIDVLRASTTILAALASGCRAIVPVLDEPGARAARACLDGEVLLAGERGGEPIPGFDLGNSPLEYTPDRVKDRTIVLTTTNGTRALLGAASAAGVGVAAFTNLAAVAAWAAAAGRDVVLVCAGEKGERALEDYVCAGHLAEHLAARVAGAALTAPARAAVEAARPYRGRVEALRQDAPWARTLCAQGRGDDVDHCLTRDTTDTLAVLDPAVHALVRAQGAAS